MFHTLLSDYGCSLGMRCILSWTAWDRCWLAHMKGRFGLLFTSKRHHHFRCGWRNRSTTAWSRWPSLGMDRYSLCLISHRGGLSCPWELLNKRKSSFESCILGKYSKVLWSQRTYHLLHRAVCNLYMSICSLWEHFVSVVYIPYMVLRNIYRIHFWSYCSSSIDWFYFQRLVCTPSSVGPKSLLYLLNNASLFEI